MPHSGLSRAIYSYTPATPEELALVEEELVFTLGEEDGWTKARGKERDAGTGLVPSNYLEDVRNTSRILIGSRWLTCSTNRDWLRTTE
jgi:hypothetical protein